MAATGGPTVRRRQLITELKRLRERAGLTQDKVAELLEWHPTKVMRIETGRTSPHPNDVRLMLDVYGISDRDHVTALVELARDARQQGWWHSYRHVLPSHYDYFIGLESEASSIRWFELAIIPGLLQTPEYARAVILSGPQELRPSEVEGRIQVRMTRQQILAGEAPPLLSAVIDEAAIRRVVGGPAVMRRQAEHLLAMSEQGKAAVQVIPFAAGPHPGQAGPFVILSFAEAADPDVVYMETAGGNLYADKSDEVALYSSAFAHLAALAMTPCDTRVMLRAMAGELR